MRLMGFVSVLVSVRRSRNRMISVLSFLEPINRRRCQSINFFAVQKRQQPGDQLKGGAFSTGCCSVFLAYYAVPRCLSKSLLETEPSAPKPREEHCLGPPSRSIRRCSSSSNCTLLKSPLFMYEGQNPFSGTVRPVEKIR